MTSKCGSRIIHHWAHFNRKQCDPWWENETEWHRSWKNYFPEECREVSHISDSGEIHRADIKTTTGIIIEIQHSHMSDEERISREEFYQNMLWIIDGSVFRKNFDIYHMLPHPHSKIADDIVWSKAKRHYNGANRGMFFRLSDARKENPLIKKEELNYGVVHWYSEIEDEIELYYVGHHQYDWVKPRKTWLDAKCPVYIDFGYNNLLIKLETYDNSKLQCIRYVSKKKFLQDVMSKNNIEDVTTIPKLKG